LTLYPGSSSPAKPGETVEIYATGFGSTSVPVTAGSALQSGILASPPVFHIGGKAAAVQFAGLVMPGLFQFNVTVPPDATDGDQSVDASYNGAATQAGTLLTIQH
jgi:uncharacterized protein (TIGR03437 family)